MTTAGNDRYRIRTMTRQEVATAVEWAAIEGWNPGLHDATCFHAADPDGFLVGLLDDEPIATISVVKYGEAFGFLGLYIVKPAYRGKGYGLRLWNAGLAYLGARTIGLDGVVAQQANYRQSGFELAHRNIRYEGKGAAHAVQNRRETTARNTEDPRIVRLSTISFDALNAYDRLLFPAERAVFLECWTRQPHSTALAIQRDGHLAGYGVIRAARTGYKIGPLFADDANLAEALFDALIERVASDSTVYLDTPETNPAAVALAERHGMTVVFETARMYLGKAPDLPISRLFGGTSFELG